MAYPTSPLETLADGAVHFAGLAFALPATFILMTQAMESNSCVTAAALYAGSLILAFLASAIYHMTPHEPIRPLLGRIDHAAIYFKIAGSYTPFVVLIGTGFAYGVLALVWALAVAGAIAKLWFWDLKCKKSLILYLGMGWLSVLLIWPMWQVLPKEAVLLVVVGGVIYSVGTKIYAHEGMRFQNAIWHCFVLTASVCLFGAVSLSI